ESAAARNFYDTATQAANQAGDPAIASCALAYRSYIPSTKGANGRARVLLTEALQNMPSGTWPRGPCASHVETLPASGRRELRDHLLVGPPACFRLVALHLLDQLAASLVPDLHARLVVQVASDAAKVHRGLQPDGGQLAGGPDTGPEQDRGAPVGASREHHPRRADLPQPPAIPYSHAGRAAAADKHPLDRSIAGHNEPVTDRIDVPERAVDPVNP